jgi:hypothetical protein
MADSRNITPMPNPATQAHKGDPDDCRVPDPKKKIREKMMDKTLADSYPASDPPSSIPDPCPQEPGDTLDEDAA